MAEQTTGRQIGILGGGTLLGREIKDVFKTRNVVPRLREFAAGDAIDKELDSATDAVPEEQLTAKTFRGISAAILAGSAADASKLLDLARESNPPPVVIDCQGLLEALPEARIVAPLLREPELDGKWLLIVAHPAASAIALTMSRLARYRRFKSIVVNVFEPASERGKPGVSELHQQTIALLNFKPLEKVVFDTQVSFNMLPRIGEDAPAQLEGIEARISRELATLLSREPDGTGSPIPSVRLVHAPVFHGYSLSLWVEFDAEPRVEEVEEALASAQIEVRRQTEEPPDNVGAAGQSGLIAGDVRVDRNNSRAVWIWMTMDNLRVVAEAAADLVRIVPLAKAAGKGPSS